MSNPEIRYLLRKEVDAMKWDHCIDQAGNGLIYGYSFYLDHMALNWDALVLGDYHAVMPLTWKTKYGISYLYQPAFTASLGVFGNGLNASIVDAFVKNIPDKFRLVEISLNHGNLFADGSPARTLRNNYILNLNQPYDLLQKGYRENIRRNVKKSQQLGLRYSINVPVSSILDISKAQMQKVSRLTETDYENFRKLYEFLSSNGKALSSGVYLSDRLLSSAVYFLSNGRAYYILVGNHPDGKTVGASHFLIDRFISDHAGTELILDFEGSDIRNLAFFYASFGAKLETYPFLKRDYLPWWARMVKKLKK